MAARPHGGLGVVQVFLVSWACACITNGIKLDGRSLFYGHEVIHPTIYSKTREKRDVNSLKVHSNELTIAFVAFNKNFSLELKRNKYLLPRHYFEKHHENGKHVVRLPLKTDENHCHYQGKLQGNKQSWVAVSTCNGISGVIYDGTDLHYIEPDHQSQNVEHLLFRAKDMKSQNLTCGVKDSLNKFPDIQQLKRIRRSAVLQDPYKSNPKSRYVELIIVNDNKEFKEFNEDKNAIYERSKQIANIVNGLYSPLNIYIALVGVIIWSEHDEIKLSPDGDATLTNFLHYRKERLSQEHPNDNAQLITAMTFDGGVVGKALKGAICTYEYSGGVNMDHSHVVGLVATTLSHEMGHNFGMEHDNSQCLCRDERCIMAPSSSSVSPRHWSSCSLEYLDIAYSQGMDYCLKNRPVDIFGPVCGNGFLEAGEDCDCGLPEFCNNHCCNATSCQLFSNATCAIGACCDMETCQVKKKAICCRESVSECDLPEFCDGISEFCPSDTYQQNGEKCRNGKAYCYNGQCQSHADQCKRLWGPTGKMSDARCYEQNYKGNVNGNCGYNRINQTYKACRKEDIFCGMLHCTHLNEKLEFGMESAAILARSFINVRGKTFTCRSAIVDLGLFNTDPGLAPNGAKCGDGKACVNQKCIPIKSMKQKECPYQCSGNGVCNDRGNCHCDQGYAPPYCNTPGPGGSIDSGPAYDTSSYLLVAMFIIFLGLLPLIIIAAVAIYYYRSHIKTWWSKKAHKANIKSRTKTTTQRKAQPPTKFNFDRNSLRNLEISAPIQISSPITMPSSSSVSSMSQKGNKPLTDRSNFHQIQVSSPDSQSSSNSIQANKLVPVRPAPPRPDVIPQRTPTWTAPKTVISPPIVRTSSIRSSNESSGKRPVSSLTFRPNCPPPRPPPPKPSSPPLSQESPCYEDMGKCSSDLDRSATPTSTYYDDCQTLDFSNTPLAFVHKPDKNSYSVLDETKHSEKFYKHGKGTVHNAQSSSLHKKPEKTTKHNVNDQSHLGKTQFPPHIVRTGETSLVASIAQKFEKQQNLSNSDETSNATLIRPPFKSRPLPPRPHNSQV